MPWRQRRKLSEAHGISADYCQPLQQGGSPEATKYPFICFVVKSVLLTRRQLRITPNKRLHFLYEPNKQVSSALKVKNTSRSFVAFKLQTNAPKSCFIRPPCGILTPGETVIISVVKFLDPSEHKRAKIKEKFKVVSLKVKRGVEYSPDLFEEQKESVAVEEHLDVVYLDPHSRSRDIEKLKKRLAEAEAAQQARKRLLVQKKGAAGGVVEEWKGRQGEKQQAFSPI